jgi:hypothetical protein
LRGHWGKLNFDIRHDLVQNLNIGMGVLENLEDSGWAPPSRAASGLLPFFVFFSVYRIESLH